MDDLGPELKRCPFCGSIAILDEVKTVSWRGGIPKQTTKYIAQCIIPKCLGHHNRSYVDEQTAVEKWNLRTNVIDEAERLKQLHIIRQRFESHQ